MRKPTVSSKALVFRLVSGFVGLLLPILLFVFFLIPHIHLPEKVELNNALYYAFATGVIVAYLLFSGRLRFVVPTILGITGLCGMYYGYHQWAGGEFDAFDGNLLGQSVFVVVLFAWLFGWAIQRSRLMYYCCLTVLFALAVQGVYHDFQSTARVELLPIATYLACLFYGVAIYELWYRFDFSVKRARFRFVNRVILFVILVLLNLLWVQKFGAKVSIDGTITSWTKTEQETNRQLETDSNGFFRNRQTMGLRPRNDRMPDKQMPLFCAHIKSTFADDDFPNPLYLTAFHFNQFDTLTETFERDIKSIFNDEFVPIPNTLPFYQWHSDSSVLKRYDSLLYTDVVETEIYLDRLSPESFVAPSTAYAIQPFIVDPNFKQTFKFAYKTRSKVSALNSAYFIYNNDNPILQAFQEQRFAVLREVPPIEKLPRGFLEYYTQFPERGKFATLKRLADSLNQGKVSAIDKVLSVRDYFLAKDVNGKPVFQYTDNPGIPGLPGASNLLYFLFENKKGYCAYYAASTVALLRLMGVPSRVVTGFLTVDRSDKNQGWYWYYADQAHAWVQVYFPGYGWIDFDTTVGDEEAREAPRPDGTPPESPKEATISWLGSIDSVDVHQQQLYLKVQQIQWGEKQVSVPSVQRTFDVRQALIQQDSTNVMLTQLQPNRRVVVVSYSLMYTNILNDTLWQQAEKQWAKPFQADAIFVLPTPKLNEAEPIVKTPLPVTLKNNVFLFVLGFVLFFILFFPYFHYRYLHWKAFRSKKSLQPALHYFLFMFCMSGYKPRNASLKAFADELIDKEFNVSFSLWLSRYWEIHYRGKQPQQAQLQDALQLAMKIDSNFNKQLSIRNRITRWCRYDTYMVYWFEFYRSKKTKS